MVRNHALIFSWLLTTNAAMAQLKGFAIVDKPPDREIQVLYNGTLLTAYCYYDSSRKPFLFPVNTVEGTTVTRGYPFKKVAGERTDHPHHTGIWLNYESVNGLDFWNNSTAIPVEKRDRYGTIKHVSVTDRNAAGNTAMLSTIAVWVGPEQKILLDEKTTHHFRVNGKDFIIDRYTTLTARDTTVLFRDVKDGMFAIRVARELELPSREKSSYIDDKGNVTAVAPSAADVTGMYHSSNGKTGDSVWSSKGTWVSLTGKKEGRDITIGIFDHPLNIGYPAYWHARGYGLFAVNPLGRKIFSNGNEELNFSLKPGQSVTLRYRVIVHSGSKLTGDQMSLIARDFTERH
jgi:hypothetical protein